MHCYVMRLHFVICNHRSNKFRSRFVACLPWQRTTADTRLYCENGVRFLRWKYRGKVVYSQLSMTRGIFITHTLTRDVMNVDC